MTKRKLSDVTPSENDGFKYLKIRSVAPATLYGENLTEEEYENRHIDHLVDDYEEEGYEVIEAESEYDDGDVSASLQVRLTERDYMYIILNVERDLCRKKHPDENFA